MLSALTGRLEDFVTNEQIIADIALSIYGEDAVTTMLKKGEDIPLHTLKGWMARGNYKVKKGEHGIETRLWKKRKKRENAETDEESDGEFYLTKAFLFRKDQIEIVKE